MTDEKEFNRTMALILILVTIVGASKTAETIYSLRQNIIERNLYFGSNFTIEANIFFNITEGDDISDLYTEHEEFQDSNTAVIYQGFNVEFWKAHVLNFTLMIKYTGKYQIDKAFKWIMFKINLGDLWNYEVKRENFELVRFIGDDSIFYLATVNIYQPIDYILIQYQITIMEIEFFEI